MRNYLRWYLVAAFLLMPTAALAHVRWFAQEKVAVRPYELTDIPVLIWIVVSILLVALGFWLDRKLRIPPALTEFARRWGDAVYSIASIGFGLSLIIFSIQRFIFAPDLHAHSLLLWLQLIAGIMILFGIYPRIGGIILLTIYLLGLHFYGLRAMIETFEMVGIALFVFIIGRPKWRIIDSAILERITHPFRDYGLPLLRVSVGLDLMVIALSEKIFDPSLTQNFLTKFHWNFMSAFGMSNYWFAFSTGVVEFLFGLFIALGLVTQITVVILAIPLLTTLTILGPVELSGHLPYFSIALVLVVMGAGKHLRMTPTRPQDSGTLPEPSQ